jgi:hypothetical protein
LEMPGPSGQAGAAVRLDISLLGTSPDPDALRAERTGMDLVERGIAIDDYEGSTMAVAGMNGYLAMVMAHGIPGVADEAHVLALAHAGAVYEVVAPGSQKNALAADQLQALADLQFVGPAPAPRCRFVLGFATLEQLLYRQVGFCLENERHNPANGDGLQQTTGGLLVWRKADNWTAFTDGYRTWVNGPNGLEFRLNTQRFAWEANPDRLPVVPDSPYGPRPPAPPYSGPLLKVAPLASAVSGPLTLGVSGSRFAPGETVILQGTDEPSFLIKTGDPMAPFHRITCTKQALGPVQITADQAGSFTASFRVVNYPGTALRIRLTAADPASGKVVSGGSGGGSEPLLAAIPAGCTG